MQKGARLRRLCSILMLIQIVTPILCHEHDGDAAHFSARPGRHLHADHLLFWLSDHDDPEHDEDHDEDAIYLPDAAFLASGPRLAGDNQPSLSVLLTVCWPELEAPTFTPDPVALPPPGSFFLDRPIYLLTRTLRI